MVALQQRRPLASPCLARRLARRWASHLRIVSVNDVYELEMLPRLKTLVARKRDEHGGGSFLTTINGDFVSPSILSSLDKGQSMVSTLNQVPMTHCCFGNHEADLKLDALSERTQEFRGVWLNSNLPGFTPTLPEWDVVTVPTASGERRVGLLGLLSSEPGIFAKNRFRGLRIRDARAAAAECAGRLRREEGCAMVIALTHQSVGADEELAADGCVDLILGGHEHEVMLVSPEGAAPVVKAGSDAHTAAVVDVTFGDAGRPEISVGFEEVGGYEPDPHLAVEVDRHLGMLRALEAEHVLSVHDSDRVRAAHEAGRTLSSKRARFQQTSVGMLLTTTIRKCLQADAAMINGGSIKGNHEYGCGEVSYLRLKQELPFPTKMILLPMPGDVLQAAVAASRAGPQDVARRGFLQLDDLVTVDEPLGAASTEPSQHRLVEVGGRPFDPAASYTVAVPRNLLKGAFDIAPLKAFAEAHPELVPAEDNYLEANVLVVMEGGRRMWRGLGNFDDMDLDGDGELDREEIIEALRKKLSTEPSTIMVDNVIASIDTDGSGTISRDEFEAQNDAPLRSR